jgi:hypothetical protein
MADLKAVECPRCDEGDVRSIGENRCGLCECRFYVLPNGRVTMLGPSIAESPRTQSEDARKKGE